MRGATYYASSSLRSIARSKGSVLSVITLRVLLLFFALGVFAAPSLAQTVIEPCPATPEPAKPAITATATKTGVSTKQTTVDAGIPDDPAVEKLIAPYREKVRALSLVIGKLDGVLKKDGAGGGSLGNFVTDGMRAQAQAKLGKPVTLAITNVGGLRKNEISAGELRIPDGPGWGLDLNEAVLETKNLFYAEGVNDTIIVNENPTERILSINGKIIASTDRSAGGANPHRMLQKVRIE